MERSERRVAGRHELGSKPEDGVNEGERVHVEAGSDLVDQVGGRVDAYLEVLSGDVGRGGRVEGWPRHGGNEEGGRPFNDPA